MLFPRKLFAVDIETTGTDCRNYDIIQIACIFLNENLETEAEYQSYIQPTLGRRDAEALKINGITEEILATAPSSHKVCSEIEALIKGDPYKYLPAAWGAYFDGPFVIEMFRKNNKHFPFSFYKFSSCGRWLDIKSIAFFASAVLNKPKWEHLSEALTIFDLSFEGKPHDALSDIRNSVKLLKRMLEITIGAIK